MHVIQGQLTAHTFPQYCLRIFFQLLHFIIAIIPSLMLTWDNTILTILSCRNVQ